jgi:hypothetical protein
VNDRRVSYVMDWITHRDFLGCESRSLNSCNVLFSEEGDKLEKVIDD